MSFNKFYTGIVWALWAATYVYHIIIILIIIIITITIINDICIAQDRSATDALRTGTWQQWYSVTKPVSYTHLTLPTILRV